MSTPKTIQCPNCGTQIDIDAIFYQQIEAQFRQEQIAERKKLQAEVDDARKKYKEHLDALKAQEQALSDAKEKFDEQVRQATREALRKEREALTQNLRKEILDEQSEAMARLQRELEAKSKQIAELNAAKIEIEQLKREKEELALKVKMEAERELTSRLAEEKRKIQKALDEEIALKLRAKDEQIEQMRRDIEAAKRKAEQGSMQVQGEALELAIEEWLASQFPFDTIEEVKKGAFGADCIQTVHTRELPNCGKIVYESKNTKAWSDGWIAKLKQDMLKAQADIGVLVTSVYPPDQDRMGFVDGIWVCSLEEFKGSVSLLREGLIRVHKSVQREENRGDKMVLLYNYLTGNEFQMQLKAIVDGFKQMQTELDKERRSLMAAWKRRQKLIDGVLQNTTEMYGALQGIAGAGAIGHIEALELPAEFEGEDEPDSR
jgi:hypothetical protein